MEGRVLLSQSIQASKMQKDQGFFWQEKIELVQVGGEQSHIARRIPGKSFPSVFLISEI